MAKFKNLNLERYLVILICSYALYLRLAVDGKSYLRYVLVSDELVGDSLGQVAQMRGSFLDMLKALPSNEISGFLSGDHILIYPFFKLFGENIWGLAMPHILITVIGFYLLYIICQQYFETLLGYVVTFGIVCFNETLTWYATEIRNYSVFPTLALAALYFSERLVNCIHEMDIKRKVGIGAYFVLLIWFHRMGILILIFPLAYALFSKVGERDFMISFRAISKYLFVVFLIASPFWFYAQMTSGFSDSTTIWGKLTSPFTVSANTYEYIPNPIVAPITFLNRILGDLIGHQYPYFLLVGILFPFFINYRYRMRQISFLTIAVFFPIGAIFLHDVLKSYWFVQRQYIWVMPLFAFFLGWSWDSLYCYLFKRGRKL